MRFPKCAIHHSGKVKMKTFFKCLIIFKMFSMLSKETFRHRFSIGLFVNFAEGIAAHGLWSQLEIDAIGNFAPDELYPVRNTMSMLEAFLMEGCWRSEARKAEPLSTGWHLTQRKLKCLQRLKIGNIFARNKSNSVSVIQVNKSKREPTNADLSWSNNGEISSNRFASNGLFQRFLFIYINSVVPNRRYGGKSISVPTMMTALIRHLQFGIATPETT